MPSGRFEFGYWDRSYEIERATFSSLNTIPYPRLLGSSSKLVYIRIFSLPKQVDGI